MRWDSPFVLALAGTLAIHLILAVAADAIVVTHPFHLDPEPVRVQMFDVKIEPAPPPKPAAKLQVPEIHVPVPVVNRPVPVQHASAQAVPHAPPPEAPPPATPTPPSGDAGGSGPTIAMPDLAPGAVGVPAARGKATNPVGRGGAGTGTGSGTGTGAGSGEAPVSVATIKTRALPKGDFSYFELGKDYPAEAKQLGIEGDIRVRLVVDDNGKVIGKQLLNHLGHGLDELAFERAGHIEFTPAVDTDNRAVTSVVVWTFHMTLPK